MKKLSKKSIQLLIGLVIFLAALGIIIWVLLKSANKAAAATPSTPGPSGSGTTSNSTTTSPVALWSDNNFPLKQGSGDVAGGDRVKKLQEFLNKGIEKLSLGMPLIVDGKLGSNTVNYINIFKSKAGIPQDGQFSESDYNSYVVPSTTDGGIVGGITATSWWTG